MADIHQSLTIEALMNFIKNDFMQKSARTDSAVQTIQRRLTEYAQAVRADIIGEHAKNIVPDFTYERKAPEAAAALLASLDAIPELGGFSDSIPAADETAAVDTDVAFADNTTAFYPTLAKVTESREALLIGGEILGDRVSWLKRQGVNVHCVSVQRSTGSTRDVGDAVARIKNGGFSFILFAGGFISHAAGGRVKNAAKEAKIQLFDVRKGGHGQMTQGLKYMESYFQALESSEK